MPFPITPQQLTLPLQQHIGAPAEATVKVGAIVEVGQKIATVGENLGAEIHAPIPGRIKAITDTAVVIECSAPKQAEEA